MSLLRLKRVLSVAGILSAVLASVGCGGSSSSSDDPVALCKQGCDKTISLCYSDGGSVGGLSAADLKSACTNACSMGASSSAGQKSCSNSSQIISAYKGCLAKTTCNDLMSCEKSIPQCSGSGTSTGGTGSGTAGKTSGSGGSSGSSSSGGTCADLLACCNKASSSLKTACMQAYSAAMGSGDSTCGAILATAKSTFCP